MNLVKSINELAQDIHTWAHSKGFYKNKCKPPCKHLSGSIASALMLIVTELSEACEADRKGGFKNFKEEITDTFIRLFDLCAAEGIDIEKEIKNKMKTNEKREHKHGKKY